MGEIAVLRLRRLIYFLVVAGLSELWTGNVSAQSASNVSVLNFDSPAIAAGQFHWVNGDCYPPFYEKAGYTMDNGVLCALAFTGPNLFVEWKGFQSTRARRFEIMKRN